MVYILYRRSTSRTVRRVFSSVDDLYKYLIRCVGTPRDFWETVEPLCNNLNSYVIECEDKNGFFKNVLVYVGA